MGHLRAGRNRVEGPSAPYPHLPVIYCGHTIIPSTLCPATFAQMFPTKYWRLATHMDGLGIFL